MATLDDLAAFIAEAFGGDVDRALADLQLGARTRRQRREAARHPRQRDGLAGAVLALKAKAPGLSHLAMAIRLSGDYAEAENADPLGALAKRIARVLRKEKPGR